MFDELSRNAGAPSSDDMDEMIRCPRLDDRTADAVFSGRLPAAREDLADVVAFAEAIRAAASAVPTPAANVALAAILERGLTPDTADLPVVEAGHAPATATPAGARTRRKRILLEALVAKMAALSLLAKAGVAAAVITTGVTGAGVTGNLPAQAQDGFDRAFGLHAPSDEPTEVTIELVTQTDELLEEVPDASRQDEEGERPENPGAEGRARASERAGDNGAAGRSIAEAAAKGGWEFGAARAAEAQQHRETVRSQGNEKGQEASAAARERAAAAGGEPGSDEPSSDARDAPEGRPVTPGRSADAPIGRPETAPAPSDLLTDEGDVGLP